MSSAIGVTAEQDNLIRVTVLHYAIQNELKG